MSLCTARSCRKSQLSSLAREYDTLLLMIKSSTGQWHLLSPTAPVIARSMASLFSHLADSAACSRTSSIVASPHGCTSSLSSVSLHIMDTKIKVSANMGLRGCSARTQQWQRHLQAIAGNVPLPLAACVAVLLLFTFQDGQQSRSQSAGLGFWDPCCCCCCCCLLLNRGVPRGRPARQDAAFPGRQDLTPHHEADQENSITWAVPVSHSRRACAQSITCKLVLATCGTGACRGGWASGS